MDYHQFTAQAEKLLVSPEFHKLEQVLTLREPNIWRIVGIANRENQISRFLAWLLNPKSNHSFGDLFLKELIMQALQTEAGQQYGVSPVEVLVLDLSQAEVKTEYGFKNKRRCDIVVSAPAEKGKLNSGFLCFIENKIWSRESKNQTVDYYKSSFDEFPEEKYPYRIYLFLTPNDTPPQCEKFIPVSYQEVLQALHNIEQKHQTTEAERFLIRQFKDNISRGIAMDQKTRDLAKVIYDQHEEVIRVLWQVGNEDEEVATPIASREWYQRSRFFNVGENSGYSWSDYREYGFICAGGGLPYRRIMERLEVGDKIYAYVSRYGYVGVGEVIRKSVPFREATLVDGRQLVDILLQGKYNTSEDDDTCDWIALVEWEYAVPKNEAVRKSPFTVSTACKIYEHRQEEVKEIEVELAKRDNRKM